MVKPFRAEEWKRGQLVESKSPLRLLATSGATEMTEMQTVLDHC